MLRIKFLIPFVGLLLLAGCSKKTDRAVSGYSEEGFVSMFDGQSLAGWKAYMDDPIENAWMVEDGILVLKCCS